MIETRNAHLDSQQAAKPRTSFYLNDAFDALALTPPASLVVALALALAPALALRIDKSTSLQYLSLSSKRCANLACSGSVDGGRSARAMT
jgi:hypothetical protein